METEYLANYYKTVYPVNCTPDLRFLASKEGVIFYSRLIEFISLPIQILTTFCILKRTPESMNYVKSSLLNVNICSILAGIVLSFFVTPFNYFPYLAGFTMGFAADLGASAIVQVIIGLAMTFGRCEHVEMDKFTLISSVDRFISDTKLRAGKHWFCRFF
ncbi:hypothetical protein CRE_09497 [Caenorhabditis remanei]|uniref:Uncharacterized protein n=1 Tax=Caenorhabditis remanei TaxID=31234 RepID=E3MIV9_CAERE|nr:hypothetical protein CRE_09497 [Caenorhabditis remanei]